MTTMAMASSSSLRSATVPFLLLQLLFAAATAPAEATGGILLPSCKTVGGGSTYFDVQFCLDALGSVGAGADARSYQDLAAVAVGLLAANATSTSARIDGLLRGGVGIRKVDAATARCLRSCRALYAGVARRQPACAAAVRGRRFGEARSSLEESAAAARGCEDGFRRGNATSPVTAENDDAFKLAKLGVALLAFA
ncbi:putative invertase inhibitor [Oryza brachyantha]|uniref:putative invertase inhibitor n=1 Tax=Oryza brachyantha TaxID=4533 RepID=UPI001ADC1607|nr:putative invertase inhibitor [Oryza brachyantha]